MSAIIPTLGKERAGDSLRKLVSARENQKPLDGLESLVQHLQNNLGDPENVIKNLAEIFIGKVVPPPGTLTFTDSNYWVTREKITNSGTLGKPTISDEDVAGLSVTIRALNLSEVVAGTHTIPESSGLKFLVVGMDGRDGTGVRQYFFASGGVAAVPPGTPIIVRLKQGTGGSAGNATTVDTRPYDLYAISDNSLTTALATSLVPAPGASPRMVAGSVTLAGNNTFGLAFQDTSSNWHLVSALSESRVISTCP